MKTLSCGLIIVDSKNDILGCHTTGRKNEKGTYDLPKGGINPDETALECAIRECREETGWDVSRYAKSIKDLGMFNYNSSKNLHLFKLCVDSLPLSMLECESTFVDRFGRERPEVDGYLPINITQLDWFSKSICNVLNKIDLAWDL